MRANDRLCRNVERIIERLLAGVTHVHHHSQAVHLSYHLCAERRYTAVSVERATCRVAYLVVAIVTQSNVDDATVGKVLHVMQVVLYRQTVFYTDHQRFSSFALVAQQVLTVAGKGDIARIAKHNLINLVEDKVSISLRCVHVERCYVRESLLWLRLRQIRHHCHSVRSALVHLMQVVEHLRVALLEAHALREEHRRVAM